jgi:predicted enzyme related to lactoylglutathione lyase
MARVTGIGGVFFKSTADHKALAEWYGKNLGIQFEPWGGAILKWGDDQSADEGVTVWHVAEKNTEWFSPSTASFMINYRIDSMSDMLKQLKQNGIDILKGPESHDNGIFAWILDPDGNKIELWEPR